ncbi:diguanylate cyclase [uncultured Paraglaciecola sp.]|uniref:diguanylate cyclase n=1 Tax=uncultured Paraglaciecola sp. TaxID=1765024 RepID=UPI0025E6FCEA|nr:diguanylate cyclase [uncultured Paraglaciecola sp.]
MQYLQWDDSLSVGLEEIDEDHKRIIEQANLLNDMVASRQSIETIRVSFANLGILVKQHFSEEERIMATYRCESTEKHIAQHQALLTKFFDSQLQLDMAESLLQVADITKEINNRIIDHIIDDDIDLAQVVHLRKWQSGAGWLNRLNYKIISCLEFFRIRSRLILVTILPLLAMIGFATVILSDALRDVRSMDQVSRWIDSTLLVQNLVHELQKERGLSSGLISSKGQKVSDPLQLQRSLSDIKLRKLRLGTQPLSEVTYAGIEHEIISLREQLDTAEIDVLQSNSRFATLISQLLNIPSTSFSAQESHDISQLTIVLLTLMQYGEAAGMERAFGAAGFSQGYFDDLLYQNLLHYAVKQQGLEQTINAYMPADQLVSWQQLLADMPLQKINDSRADAFTSLKQNLALQRDGTFWWQLTTAKIDMLYQFEQQLALQLKTMADSKQSQVMTTLIATSITMAVVIVLTGLLSVLLGTSIVRPIERIAKSLRELANGNRQILLPGTFKNNEIGPVVNAYESLRRGMTRMVILEQSQMQHSFVLRQQMQVLDEQIKKGDELQQMAVTDTLTGVLNRRGFFAYCDNTLLNVHRDDTPLSVLMLDIDFFKVVNDTYGHAVGDKVLRHFADICQQELRSQDVFGRLGGEEFAVLLVGSEGDTACAIVERIRCRVSDSVCRVGNEEIRITVSVGVASVQVEETNIETALKKADSALYKAKANGRNCAALA